jgi:hypothetical protein
MLDENKLKIEALDSLHGRAENQEKQHKDNIESLNELNERLELIDFHQHRNEVELSGIPETTDECLIDVLDSIGFELEMGSIYNEVKSVERLGSNSRRTDSRNSSTRKNILVKFHSIKIRDEFVSRGRSFMKKHTTPNTSRFAHDPAMFKHRNLRFRCHFNDYLSPRKKLLLAQCKEYGKCVGIKVFYAKCNQIFARRTQDVNPVNIRKLDDLKNL